MLNLPNNILNIILIITATATGLMAGLFYSYSISVIPGLGKLKDQEYIAAMQSINEAILNTIFYMGFFGALILLPLSAFLHYKDPLTPRFLFLLFAAIIYVLGVFAVTVIGNIPLNKSIERFNLETASAEAITSQRADFENRWNRYNTVRTISSVTALILVIMACLGTH